MAVDTLFEDEETYQQCAERIAKESAAWQQAWPNHCKACGGWGGANINQSHPYGSGTATETLFDPCGAIENPATCHRCGQDGLSEDGEGPCKYCGWNYDDGDPTVCGL